MNASIPLARRAHLRRLMIAVLITTLVGLAATAASPTPACATTCDPTGLSTNYDAGANTVGGNGNATCTGSYQTCLEARSQVSGWSAPFACHTGSYQPTWLIWSDRTTCTTGVFYRVAAKYIGNVFVYSSAANYC
jgi:hypothetical protein